MPNKKKYLASISAIALMLATSGCLDSSTEVANNDIQNEFSAAQAQQYARSFEQYAMQSSQLLAQSAAWAAGQYEASAGIIDMASIGGGEGSSESFVQSGYCITDPLDPVQATHVTWFESLDDDEFMLKGLGSDSYGSIVSKLTNLGAGIDVATYMGDGEYMGINSIDIQELPADCHFADMPLNSPILITQIDLPQMPEDTVHKTEYSTAACTAGQSGHKLYSTDVTYFPDGRFFMGGAIYAKDAAMPVVGSAGWNLVEDNCADPVITATMETVASSMIGTSFSGGMITGSNDVAKAVTNNLGRIACQEAAKYETSVKEETNDSHDEFDEPYESDESDVMDSYSTCSDGAEIIDVANVGDTLLNLDRVEDHTTECQGTPGTFEDSVNSFLGTVTYPAWTGEVHYTREIYTYETENIINASVDREMRENWVGQSISCDRPEDLNITCAISNPDLTTLDLIDGRGFNYQRNNTIRGWANAEDLIPNDPENPTWDFLADVSGCNWREQDTWGCNVGNVGQTQQGKRERNYTVASLGATPDISGWQRIKSAKCEDTKETTESCPTGQTGAIRITEERIYTSNSPGNGSWGAWSVVSTQNNCTNDNEGDGDAGGSTSCLLAGTRVLMADGSTKAIENVQIGEATATGRVLQTYKRLYNNGTQQGSTELFMNNGGLFEHDGIRATGRHPLFLDGQWHEMGDNRYATPIEGSQGTIVYNLLTESHVIPVIGDSGEIYAYADDLNNIHDSAEKGRIQNASLFQIKTQKKA